MRRRRYLWALIPAFLAIGQFGIQGAISAYGNLHDWAYSWSYEIRWVVDFAIYLAYLAGLASFDTWRRGRIWIALAFTAAFFTLTIGGFTDSKPGMIAWILGYLLICGFGFLLVGLVFRRHRLAAQQDHEPNVRATTSH